MVGEWTQSTLGEVADKNGYGLVDGPFGSNLPASCYTEEGVPVIRGSNLTLGTGRFRADEFVFVSEATANRLERSLCRPLDIVFTKKGTLGQTGLVPKGGKYDLYLLSSNQMKLTVDRRLADPLFVYYFVSSPESTAKIIRDSEATGVPKTNVAYLREFPISLPPLPEQRAIAHILGTLDDKIELSRRTNETLEAMARALFKSWFVDFDRVRAKTEGRDLGLPQPLLDLFPDSFVDSALGEIPTGWEMGGLDEVTDILAGYAFKSTDWIEKGVPVIKIGSVKPGVVDLGVVSYVSEEVAENATRFRLSAGDLLIGMTGYVGEVGLVPHTDNPPLLNQRVGKFLLEKGGTAALAFMYCLTRQPEFKAQVETKSHGTAQANVSAEGILSINVLVPPKPIRDEFNRVLQPILDRILKAHAESASLALIRDTLLPKLISGELRVADAERFVKAAT